MMNSNEKKDIQVFWALRFFAFLLIYIHHTPELNRFIRETRILNANDLITEGRIKNMSDTEWLNSLYGGSGRYIRRLYF